MTGMTAGMAAGFIGLDAKHLKVDARTAAAPPPGWWLSREEDGAVGAAGAPMEGLVQAQPVLLRR
jgi:hypothetical protein